MNKAFDRFKALADRKKNVYDEDLIAIVAEESTRVAGDATSCSSSNVTSSSTARRRRRTVRAAHRRRGAPRRRATGDGMVDACYKAIAQIAGIEHPQLERYAVKAITGGTDAQGEVSCLLARRRAAAIGQGAHTDIIMASALAYRERAEQARVPAHATGAIGSEHGP